MGLVTPAIADEVMQLESEYLLQNYARDPLVLELLAEGLGIRPDPFAPLRAP